MLQRQRISVSVNRTSDKQIATDFTPRGIGNRFIDPQLVKACAAFEMEIVKQVENHVAGGGDKILVPTQPVAVDRNGAAAMRQEAGSQPHILHHLIWRI